MAILGVFAFLYEVGYRFFKVFEEFCCDFEHGDLRKGLEGRGETGRGAEKNVDLNKNQ